jgi:hypothetical protein
VCAATRNIFVGEPNNRNDNFFCGIISLKISEKFLLEQLAIFVAIFYGWAQKFAIFWKILNLPENV